MTEDINSQLKAFGMEIAVMPLGKLKAYAKNNKQHGKMFLTKHQEHKFLIIISNYKK